MTSLKFSLTLPRYIDAGERDPFKRTYDFARFAEDLGYYSFQIDDHFNKAFAPVPAIASSWNKCGNVSPPSMPTEPTRSALRRFTRSQ